MRLLLELYCVIATTHVAFFTISEKLLLTMAFTFTFLDVIVVSNLKKNIRGMTDLAGKKGTDQRNCIPLTCPLCYSQNYTGAGNALDVLLQYVGFIFIYVHFLKAFCYLESIKSCSLPFLSNLYCTSIKRPLFKFPRVAA